MTGAMRLARADVLFGRRHHGSNMFGTSSAGSQVGLSDILTSCPVHWLSDCVPPGDRGHATSMV